VFGYVSDVHRYVRVPNCEWFQSSQLSVSQPRPALQFHFALLSVAYAPCMCVGAMMYISMWACMYVYVRKVCFHYISGALVFLFSQTSNLSTF